MNLNPSQIEELNTLLKQTKLDLPAFRKEVNKSGANFTWLQKNITRKNPELSPRIKELLGI